MANPTAVGKLVEEPELKDGTDFDYGDGGDEDGEAVGFDFDLSVQCAFCKSDRDIELGEGFDLVVKVEGHWVVRVSDDDRCRCGHDQVTIRFG